MKQTKTLNVSDEIHQSVKLAAAQHRVPIGLYAEAVLAVGLKREKEIMRLLAESTKQEPLPE
jgi:hypothetical protein